ncbi:hypothetical protein FKP32DRAFT_91041 [Trametes sanguinea]|nr:hypothetical protein FKP32DRAFT_91041 [Trametes sanguinea]
MRQDAPSPGSSAVRRSDHNRGGRFCAQVRAPEAKWMLVLSFLLCKAAQDEHACAIENLASHGRDGRCDCYGCDIQVQPRRRIGPRLDRKKPSLDPSKIPRARHRPGPGRSDVNWAEEPFAVQGWKLGKLGMYGRPWPYDPRARTQQQKFCLSRSPAVPEIQPSMAKPSPSSQHSTRPPRHQHGPRPAGPACFRPIPSAIPSEPGRAIGQAACWVDAATGVTGFYEL